LSDKSFSFSRNKLKSRASKFKDTFVKLIQKDIFWI